MKILRKLICRIVGHAYLKSFPDGSGTCNYCGEVGKTNAGEVKP